MIEDLARALHVSHGIFYTLMFGTLIIGSLLLGFVLNRVLHYWAKRLHNGWGSSFFSLLESLPIPLLLIASLDLGLESLPLPRRYEHIGSNLIFALVILVMMYFPARVIVIALRRAGQKDPKLLRVTQPAALVVRTLFALLGTIIFLENMGVLSNRGLDDVGRGQRGRGPGFAGDFKQFLFRPLSIGRPAHQSV